MEFPVSYNTFTVPTGAGPTQSRLVISSDGSLTSYNYDFSPPVFVRLFDGGVYFGTVVNGTADMTHAGLISYSFAGGSPNPPALILDSPTNTAFPYIMQMAIRPGSDTANPFVQLATNAPDGGMDFFVVGDIHARNIETGFALVSIAAGNWVQLALTFANTHTTIPAVIVGGANMAPSAGASSTNLMFTTTNVTTTGFTLCAYRTTAITNMRVAWIAIG